MYLDYFRNAPKSDVSVAIDSEGHFLIWQLNYQGSPWAYFQSVKGVEDYLKEQAEKEGFEQKDWTATPLSVIKD